jgi:transposase-like protein
MIAAVLRKLDRTRIRPGISTKVYLKIDGRLVYPWRAVDAEGEVAQ